MNSFLFAHKSLVIPMKVRFPHLNPLILALFLVFPGISAFSQMTLTVDAPDEPTDCGTQVTYHVRVDGFDNTVKNLNFLISWDINQLEFVSSSALPAVS